LHRLNAIAFLLRRRAAGVADTTYQFINKIGVQLPLILPGEASGLLDYLVDDSGAVPVWVGG
jgi:hypothetical protein